MNKMAEKRLVIGKLAACRNASVCFSSILQIMRKFSMHCSDSSEDNVSNAAPITVIFAKTVVGAGVAALPLTDAALGWLPATAFLLLIAWTTKESLDIIVRAGDRCKSVSYPDITRRSLSRRWALLLDISFVAFCVGLMIVYNVIIGDMLVGQGTDGILCGRLGGLSCSRPFIIAVVTVLILFPFISFRRMESLAFAGWIGTGALLIWAVATLVLVIVAAVLGETQPVSWKPDVAKLGSSGLQIFATLCSVIPTLTTAYSCQAAGMFALSDLRPGSPSQKHRVILAGVLITTAIYVLLTVGSYVLFGEGVKPDVLQNFSVDSLHHLLPDWLSWTVYIVVRLSFLAGVLTLYPLMMFPARDGLMRLFGQNSANLKPAKFYLVTYIISALIMAVAIVTPSIKGPIQIVGATAGAVIGFIIPGLLAFRQEREEDAELLLERSENEQLGWKFTSYSGWILLALGVIQCVTGVVAQAISSS